MLLFDIVFKSGEFYGDEGSFIQDFIIAVVGAGIGAYVTFRVFRETLKADREKEDRARAEEKEKETKKKAEEQEQEQKRRKDLDKERMLYFRYLIKGSITFTKTLVKGIDTMSSKFEENKMDIPVLPTSHKMNVHRLVHKIDQDIYFNAYRNEVDKDSRNEVKDTGIFFIFNALDFIEYVNSEIGSLLSKAFEADFQRKLEFKNRVEELIEMMTHYKRVLEESEQVDTKNYQIMYFLLSNYIEIGKKSSDRFEQVIDKVVTPLFDFYYSNPVNSTLTNIIDQATKVNQLPATIIGNNELIVSALKNYASKIKVEVLPRLEQESKQIDAYCKNIYQ